MCAANIFVYLVLSCRKVVVITTKNKETDPHYCPHSNVSINAVPLILLQCTLSKE